MLTNTMHTIYIYWNNDEKKNWKHYWNVFLSYLLTLKGLNRGLNYTRGLGKKKK